MARIKSTRTKYTSKGERNNVSKRTRREMRKSYMESGMRTLNQQKALAAGKDIVVTIANPNVNETNRPFIRQRISGKSKVRVGTEND